MRTSPKMACNGCKINFNIVASQIILTFCKHYSSKASKECLTKTKWYRNGCDLSSKLYKAQ